MASLLTRTRQTGGVTLTLSLAYLSVLAHQRTREHQSRHLGAQALALQSLVDPVPQPLPPSRAEMAAARRAASIEAAKDRWNDEVGKAARWAQSTDWDEVREGLEARVAGLWATAFGESVDAAEATAGKLEPLAHKTETAAKETAREMATAARAAFDGALDKARTRAERSISPALERGQDRAQEVAGMVKSAVGLAEDKTADGTDGKGQSAVQKALQQRYEKAGAETERTAAEVLRARYTPMDQRDTTVLRGL